MSDIYKAPEAQLTNNDESGSYGSLAKGVAGDYSISIGEIFREAWERTKGNKGTVWLGFLLYIVTAAVVTYLSSLITGYPAFDPEAAAEAGVTTSLLHQLLVTIALAPLAAGLVMIGIKLARDESVSGTEVFAHFDKIVPLAIGIILAYLLTGIGLLLLILPGIYLAVAYLMTVPLIADKKLGPWAAMEASRKAITKHWFAFFGFLIVSVLVYLLGGLALVIGLIWAIPTMSIAFGIVYRNMFGAGPEA